MRFSIVTYNNEGILDRCPLTGSREQTVTNPTLVIDYLNGRPVVRHEVDWLMRALVIVPGLGIFPLMMLRDFSNDRSREYPRFTAYALDLVRATMTKVLSDPLFGHDFLKEMDGHIRDLQKPVVVDCHHQHPVDPNVTDLAEAVLALMEAVRVIDKAYNCVLPNALLGNLEQCQDKIRNMTVRVD